MRLIFALGLSFVSQVTWAKCSVEVTKWLKHDQKLRSYQLYVPCRLSNSPRLLVLFHSSMSSGKSMSQTLNAPVVGKAIGELAEENDTILVYPDGLNEKGKNFGLRVWNDGRGFTGSSELVNDSDDFGFVEKLLSQLKSEYNLKNEKIYLSGLAMGGAFVYSMACKMGNLFGGVMPVSSHLSDKVMRNCPINNDQLNFYVINGTWDTAAPYCNGNESSVLLPNICANIKSYDARVQRPQQLDLSEITGPMLSPFQTQNFFLRRFHCELSSTSELMDDLPVPSELTAVQNYYYRCSRSRFKISAIFGGGHVWPGGSEASGLTKNYFLWLVGPVSHEILLNEEIFQFMQ